jgi:hypothetical protein
MVGRRWFVLPFAFLGLAACLAGAGVARAQSPAQDPHKLWSDRLTPEQIKTALSKLSLGGEDENDPLHKMLRGQLQKEFPDIPKDFLDAVIKRALSDPKFMEQARKQALAKHTDPGRTPKFDQDDLAKLANEIPRQVDQKDLPPGVKMPDNWKVQPKRPPDSVPPPTLPTPGEKRPADPKDPPPPMGGILEPKMPDKPKKDSLPGTDEQRQTPPQGGPAPAAPPPPTAPEDTLFRPPDEPTDPRTKSLQAFAAVWERNVGPLDETPEVKKALFDLASGANGLNLDLLDDKGNSIWDLLRKGDGSGVDFGDFMDGSGGNWKLPSIEMPSLRFGSWFGRTSPGGRSSSSSWNWSGPSLRPRAPSTGGSGFGGSWYPVIVLGVVVLAIVLWIVLKNLRTETPELAMIPHGLGPWPIDPRRINTREDVVKAFEYLSVLICGMAARNWTHNTIAGALADLATTHGETAVMLARLYELARYAPLDEPLSHYELMETRELVCGLAGVSY